MWYAFKCSDERTFDLMVCDNEDLPIIQELGCYSFAIGPMDNPEELMAILEDTRPYGFNIMGRGEHTGG